MGLSDVSVRRVAAQNDEFRIKNDGFSVKNDELCIQNDGFCDKSAGTVAVARLCGVTPSLAVGTLKLMFIEKVGLFTENVGLCSSCSGTDP